MQRTNEQVYKFLEKAKHKYKDGEQLCAAITRYWVTYNLTDEQVEYLKKVKDQYYFTENDTKQRINDV